MMLSIFWDNPLGQRSDEKLTAGHYFTQRLTSITTTID
jgi:hypothetical protein